MWGWTINDRYTTLSARVGMDGLDTDKAGVTVSFEDSTNTRIPFVTGGKLVFQATVPTTGFISVSVNVAHESVIQVSFSVAGSGGSVVDVVNDRLS